MKVQVFFGHSDSRRRHRGSQSFFRANLSISLLSKILVEFDSTIRFLSLFYKKLNMKSDLTEIQTALKDMLYAQAPSLRIRHDEPTKFEACGTKEVMQGKQKVDGHYFASVIPKAKDIRLYFFPIYTHVDQFSLSPDLKKYLKGKSCFHIKKLTPEVEVEIKSMIEKGVEIYEGDELI